MEVKFTSQDVIDMASELYDNQGFSRYRIHKFLTALVNMGAWDATPTDLERVFDLIVG